MLTRYCAYALFALAGTYPVAELRTVVWGLEAPYSVFAFGLLLLVFPMLLVFWFKRLTSFERLFLIVSIVLVIQLAAVTALQGASDLTEQMRGLPYLLLPGLAALLAKSSGFSYKELLWAFLFGLCGATAYGYYGYFSGAVGLYTEHALGYWGIRYMQATRNSDVLYPLSCFFVALSLFHRVTPMKFLVLFFVTSFSGMAVVLSESRGAWIAMLVGLLLVLRYHRYRFLTSVGALLIGAIGLLLSYFSLQAGQVEVSGNLGDRLSTIADWEDDKASSNLARLRLIELSLKAVLDNPLGVGLENFGSALGGVGVTGNAENAFLNLAVEGGVLGLALFSYALFSLTRQHLYISRGAPSQVEVGVLGLLGALWAYLMFNYELNAMLPWYLVGVLVIGAPKRFRCVKVA